MKIFPVEPGGKRPLISEWQSKATDGAKQIEAWRKQFPGCNFAIACGPSGITVLDVDPGGNKALTQLDLRYGVPKTRIVTTPRGGQHLYFTGLARNRVRFLPGLDSRSSGGYVLAPGSVVSGIEYKQMNGSGIAPLPPWLASIIGEPKEKKDRQEDVIGEVDSPEDLRRAVAFLISAPPAIEHQGGNERTYRTACVVRDLGISQNQCLELMTDQYNPRCSPPWTEADLGAIVEHAYQYAQNPQGNRSSQGILLEVAQVFTEKQENLIFPVSQYGHSFPSRDWVVDTLIPMGASAPTLLTGNGNVGKSLLALQMAVACSTGTKFLDVFQTKQMPVLFVTCEDDNIELNRRLYSVRKNQPFLNLDSAPLFLMPRIGQEAVLCLEQNGEAKKGPFYTVLDAALSALKKQDVPGLLILDTVADLYAGNENIRSAVTGFLKHILGSLTVKHNVTALLIAHPPKTNATYAGSTAWHNSVRNRLWLDWQDAKKKSTIRTLKHEKNNYGKLADDILLDWEHGVLKPIPTCAFEQNIDSAVLDAIAQKASEATPLCLAPQSPRYIGKALICGTKGDPISTKLILESVTRLIETKQITVKTGRNSGLYSA